MKLTKALSIVRYIADGGSMTRGDDVRGAVAALKSAYDLLDERYAALEDRYAEVIHDKGALIQERGRIVDWIRNGPDDAIDTRKQVATMLSGRDLV